MVRNKVAVLGVDKRMEGLKKRQDRVEEQMNNERERLRRERAEEMRERELRRKSVVLHRVEEAGDWARTAEERREWDVKSVEKIFRTLKLELCRKVIKFCRRVGEKGDEPRPMVVGLNREYQKEDFLEAAKDRKNTDFENVGIALDQTQEQRKDEVEMGQEAERRNANFSEDDRAKNLGVDGSGEERRKTSDKRNKERRRRSERRRTTSEQRRSTPTRRMGASAERRRGTSSERRSNRTQPAIDGSSESEHGREGRSRRERTADQTGERRNDRRKEYKEQPNSKRNREENGSDEERVPQPQPSPAAM